MTVAVALGICFVAGCMNGLTGFGFGVVAAPLLLLVQPADWVVPVVLALTPLTGLALLAPASARRAVDRALATRLTTASAVGLPIGFLLLMTLDTSVIAIVIGVIIIGYALWQLSGRTMSRVGDSWLIPFGLVGGALSTSTGLNGPAVALAVGSRRLPHPAVLATMSAYVTAVSLLSLLALAVAGRLEASTMIAALPLLPAALAGVLTGRWWQRHTVHRQERQALLALVLMGVLTVVRAVIAGFAG